MMMVPIGAPMPGSDDESLYALLTTDAARASWRTLLALLCCAVVGGALILVREPTRWPFAALCGASAAVAGWGIVAHLAARHDRRPYATLQRVLVVLGTALAVSSGIGLFFLILGPSWMS